jgi:hypothetical protein
LTGEMRHGRLPAAEELVGAVILRSPALRDDEESRMFMKMLRARFFAQFILSGQCEILRFAQNDSSEGSSRSLSRRIRTTEDSLWRVQ